MEALIGTVRRLNGNYFLRTPEGETKQLQVGDQVHAEDYVYGENDNTYYDHLFVSLEGIGSDILLIKSEGRRFNEAMVEEHLASLNRVDRAVDPDALETAAGEEEAAVASTESTDNGFEERLDFHVDVEAELNRNISVEPGTAAERPVLAGEAPLDINNAPTVDAASADAVEGGSIVSGQLLAVDGDIGATAVFTIPEGETAPAGFELNGDGSWHFDPSHEAYDEMYVGEVRSIVVPVNVTDDRGATITTSITLSVTGTNDTPLLNMQTDASLTEDTDVVSGNLTQQGTIAYSDVDSGDTHTLSAAYNSDIDYSGGTLTEAQITRLTQNFALNAGQWEYQVANNDVQFLREGETVTFSYNVTVTDNSGANDSETVNISITGTNELPAIDSVTSPMVTAVPPLPDGDMVFWYDTSNSDASGNWIDQSGNGRNATEVGSSGVFTTADHQDINAGSYNAKTLAVSFTTATVSAGDPFQVIYEQGGTVNGYSISVVGDHAYAFVWAESYNTISPNYRSIDLGVIQSDTDYSIALVHDASAPNGGSLTAYLNGSAVGSLDGVGTMGAHVGDVGIGGVDNHTVHPVTYANITSDGLAFTGTISEMVAWNSALDAAAIADVNTHMYPPADLTPPQTTVVEVATDDVSPGTVLFNVSGTDVEDTTLDYALVDTHSGLFAVDADGAITLQGTLNEHGGSYSLEVNVTDSDGGIATQTVTVNVKPESVGLDGLWDMSDNAKEVSGTGDVVDNGVLQRGATVSNGVLVLDGVNDYVSLGSSADINQPGPFAERSISLWFKTDGSSGNQYLWGEGGGTRALQIYLDSDGEIHAQGYNKRTVAQGENGWNTQTVLNDTTDLADGEWHNVTVTLTGDPNDPLHALAADGFKLYVDGELKDSGTGGALFGHNPAKIGANYSGKNTFAGEIDEVRLYNSELSADEVTTLNDAYIENSIVGTAADEIIAGTDLNEEIDGGAGSDEITAGAGNDTIVFDSGDSSIDGGAGFDTIAVSEPTVDFGTISDNVSNIEEIRFESSNQTFKLGLDDVVKMTDGADTMRLTADTDGKLQLSLTDSAEEEAQWEATGGSVTDVNGHVYDIYTSLDKTVTLQVDQQLTVEDF